MPTPTSASSSVRQRVALLARLAIGVTILVVLFSKIPWQDRVILTGGDGVKVEFDVQASDGDPGRLVGQNVAEGWEFEFDEQGDQILSVSAPSGEAEESWRAAEASFQPGLGGSLSRLSVGSYLIASLLALLGTITASLRWKVLLGAVGLRIPIKRAVQLNLAGLAASQVLLGSVGGDLVKGALITRDAAVPDQLSDQTGAVLTLMMDRIVGLTALLAIATLAAFMIEGDSRDFATWFGGGLAILLTGVVSVLLIAGRFDFPSGSTTVWRILHSLHAALGQYRQRPRALIAGLLLSFASHSFLIAAIALLGTALGMQVEPLRFFLLIPIVETVQAVPISPAGWGVAESMYVVLFEEAGETASLALTLALTVRAVTLTQALLGVPGLLLLLRQRKASRSATED